MPLTYVPEKRRLVAWGGSVPSILDRCLRIQAFEVIQVLAPKPGAEPGEPRFSTEVVRGPSYSLRVAVPVLGAAPHDEVESSAPTVGAFCLASRFALDLVARERAVPVLVGSGSESRLRWSASFDREDRATLAALAAAFPPAAFAARAPGLGEEEVASAESVLKAFLDEAIDAFLRASDPMLWQRRSIFASRWRPTRWEERFVEAASGEDGSFGPSGLSERSLPASLADWVAPALELDSATLAFRMEMPSGADPVFPLRPLVTLPGGHEPERPALEALHGPQRLSTVQVARLEHDLRRAGALFQPLEELDDGTVVLLSPAEAWAFAKHEAERLRRAGFRVDVPGELTGLEVGSVTARLRLGTEEDRPEAELSLQSIVPFSWEVLLGEEVLSVAELEELALSNAPLVRLRGQWLAIDRTTAAIARSKAGDTLDGPGALRAALVGEHRDAKGVVVPVVPQGALVRLLSALRDAPAAPRRLPRDLAGTLRPYQEKGLSWLLSRAAAGAGGCLADDMGLGKTIQMLAFLLARREERPKDKRPILLVAPTSVLGNWEREANRFAPSLSVRHHYGPGRSAKVRELTKPGGSLIITSYGVLRRDAELLAKIDFSTVILDEAQNIKNPSSAAARAARELTATHRFALTGTPVENRLTELWSILEFSVPGLLGSLQSFRKHFASPIERLSDPAATERLRRLAGPFVLRRLKSDPLVIQDLPPKNEMTVFCTLTKEQATLYAAVVREELRRVTEAEGLARRGRILALLTALKQVCNHPVQYLHDLGPLVKRSGKLSRLLEMLEEALDEGDKVLVFTQYREMGDLLSDAIEGVLGAETLFLHGGTSRKEREKMVKTFQSDSNGPRVFILSLKAGGTGLNLTAANRVFHFDRWWNPAVEDQATDRAYRIGQTRPVQVHKLVCQGTLEEKIDALLTKKRGLADRIVGEGEAWLTELSDRELENLVSLSAADLDVDDTNDDEDPQ